MQILGAWFFFEKKKSKFIAKTYTGQIKIFTEKSKLLPKNA